MFDLTSGLRNVRNADCMPVLERWTLVLRCLPPWLQTRAWVTPKQEVPCYQMFIAQVILNNTSIRPQETKGPQQCRNMNSPLCRISQSHNESTDW